MMFRMNHITLLAAIFTLVVVSAAMSIDFGWGDSAAFTISSPAGIAWADSAPFTINIPAIPTMSAWGVVAMMLLVLTAGTLVYLRRREPAT